jgi:hypothetical protein
MPGKKIAIDESTDGFKHKIIFESYNAKKPMKWGIRLLVLADSDTGYAHSVIPNHGKHTDDLCNWPYSEKLHFKNSSFLDGQTMTQCVWY